MQGPSVWGATKSGNLKKKNTNKTEYKQTEHDEERNSRIDSIG